MSKLPSVVSSIPQDLKAFINQVREALDGRNGEKLVTVNDLIRGGLAVAGPNNTVVPPAGGGVVSTPATPRNVQASGAIQNIVVTWDDPLYNGHAYAEVWGSSTDDLGAAVQVGMTPGAIFVDAVGPSVIRYYWVRFVNVLGVQGAFNAVAGVQGVTGSDVGYLLDTLTEAALDPDSDYSKFAVRADFFYVMPSPDFNQEATPTATATGDLWYQPSTELVRTWTGSTWGSFSQTLPFVVNSSPQTINGVAVPAGVYMDAAFIKNGTITNAKIGNATIDDAKIVNLSAAKITAGSISVGSFIQSSNYLIGSQGWKIHGDGTAEFAAAAIRGQLTASQINSNGLSIRDTSGNIILNAGTGVFNGTTSASNVSGLGALATQNTVSGTTQVTGLGGFAYLSSITSANISTYIASAAIGNAYISSLSATKLTAGSIAVGQFIRSSNYSAGSAGWEIDGNGDAEFNELTVRSGQVIGALLRAVKVNSYSGVYVEISGGTPISTVNGPFYINGSGLPYYILGVYTMPAPETAAHRVAAVINVQSIGSGASKDLAVVLIANASAAGSAVYGEQIAFNTNSGTFGLATNGAGISTSTYSTATTFAVLVGGNNAAYTVQTIDGLLFGVR
jgi:hypothetical protein